MKLAAASESLTDSPRRTSRFSLGFSGPPRATLRPAGPHRNFPPLQVVFCFFCVCATLCRNEASSGPREEGPGRMFAE